MRPFAYNNNLFDFLRNKQQKIIADVRKLENDYVLRTSQTELEEYFINKIQIEPLNLLNGERYIKKQEHAQIREIGWRNEYVYVDGTIIDIAIPFKGDDELWKYQPSKYLICGCPDIEISKGEIVLSFSINDSGQNQAALEEKINRDIGILLDMVSFVKHDVDGHNDTSKTIIINEISKKIESAKKTSGIIASLNIPMKRTDSPPAYAVPAKRKTKPTSFPKVQTEKYELEPYLEMKEYEYILNITRSLSLVIERSPKTFSNLDEEAIRTHFLIHLNGHYEGNATGETFNASGKTDILIRENNKNVFIAECKFWRGPKVFIETIDQVLGYSTWRDSKIAVLIFNKNKNTSDVRDKMHQIMEELPEHVKTVFHNKDGDSRYVLVKKDEPGKDIYITTQIFDIPQN